MPQHLNQQPSKALVIAAFAALYLIWGSTYLGILYAIQSIPPFFMIGSRFSIAGLLLFVYCLVKGEKLPPVKSLRIMALGGILMLFVGNGAVVWAEQYLPSGLVAIIVATVPLWFVALDKREWKNNFSNKGIIAGLLIGFAGVLLLFAGKSSAEFLSDRSKLLSLLIVVIGSIGWSGGSLYTKYKKVEGSTPMKVAIQMMAAGVFSFIVGLLANEQENFKWKNMTQTSLLALLYLILIGSLVAYIAYIWLLGVRSPSLVGTYAYVNPVVAVFLGWLIASETISTQKIIGLAVILCGVLMVSLSKEKIGVQENKIESSTELPDDQWSVATKAE